jgi:Uma2 family endonuclease
MIPDLLKPLLASPELPQLIAALHAEWQEEQRRRHAFWKDVDEGRKAEFIQGEIIYYSPVYGRHWMVSTNLVRWLVPYVYDRQLGKVGVEKVMIRLTRNDYEPDLCFWRAERAAAFGATQSVFPPPDFVVEILSDSTRERDRGLKWEDYARHGISEYWIIDPDDQTLEQWLLAEGRYALACKLREGSVEARALPGFRLALADLFAGLGSEDQGAGSGMA